MGTIEKRNLKYEKKIVAVVSYFEGILIYHTLNGQIITVSVEKTYSTRKKISKENYHTVKFLTTLCYFNPPVIREEDMRDKLIKKVLIH